MKTRLLVVALLALFMGVSASAQTFQIDWDDDLVIEGSENDDDLKVYGTIRNLDADQKRLLFTYDLTDAVTGHNPALCFSDNCFFLFPGEDEPELRNTQKLAPSGDMRIYAYVIPLGVKGVSTINYCVYDSSDVNDKICFTIVYAAGVSTSVPDASTLGLSVGPMPAVDMITVRGDVSEQITGANIYSFDGNLVRSFGVAAGQLHTFSVSGLATGSYHLMLTTGSGQVVRAPVTVVR